MWSSAVKALPMKNVRAPLFCFTSVSWHRTSCTIKTNNKLIILEIKHAKILTIYLLVLPQLLEEICNNRIIGIIRDIQFCCAISNPNIDYSFHPGQSKP